MIGVGVVGYGTRGACMAAIVARHAQASLRGIADTSPDILFAVRASHPGWSVTGNWSDLLADGDIEALIVATPVDTHFEIALAGLRAGKHVLIKAPFTATADQAGLLVQEAIHRGRILMAAHTPVYSPAVIKIGEMIKAGELGEIFLYEAVRRSLIRRQDGVAQLWAAAINDLSLLDHIVGSSPAAVSVNAPQGARGEVASMLCMTLYFDNGLVSHLHMNWLNPVEMHQTLIAGSRRMILYDEIEPRNKVKVYGRNGGTGVGIALTPEDRLATYLTADMWAPYVPSGEAEAGELDHFIDCIYRGSEPVTSGMSGLRVVRLLEAATRSLRHNGEPVELRVNRRRPGQ